MNKDYGLCLIGAGFIGKKYAEVFSGKSSVRLEVMCDINYKNAEDIASRFGFAGIETDWRKAIDNSNVDIVCVCVPNNMHYDIIVSALELNKHVLCEKPLTQSAWQSYQLAQLKSEKQVIAACNYNLIFLPAVKYAKKIIETGQLGQLISFRGYYDNERLSSPDVPFEWRLAKKNSIGGSICDLGINILSISHFLFGKIHSVIGALNIVYSQRKDINGRIRDVENEDLCHFLIKYKNGAIGSINCNRIAAGSKQDMGFIAHFQKGTIRFSMEHMNELHICTSDSTGFTIVNSDDGQWFCIGYEELKTKAVEAFLSNITNRTEPEADLSFAAEIDRVVEAVIQSSTIGQWVEI